MNLLPRQIFGIALILISLLAAVIIQITTGNLFHITTTEEPPVGGPVISYQIIAHVLTLTWRYAAPILAGVALGLCCLLIPRHPTKAGS